MTQSSIVVVSRDENHNLNEVVRALDENLPQRLCNPEALTLEIHESKKAAVWVSEAAEANAICEKLRDAGLSTNVLSADQNVETVQLLQALTDIRKKHKFAALSRRVFDALVVIALIAGIFFAIRWINPERSHPHPKSHRRVSCDILELRLNV